SLVHMPHGAWEAPHQVSLLPSRQVAQRAVDDLSGSFFSPLVRGLKPVIIIAAEKLLCNLRQLAAAKISLQTWREAHRRLNHDEFMPTIEWFNRYMPREALSSVAGDHLASGKISDCFEVMIRLAEAEIAELCRITGCSQWLEEMLPGLRAREDLSVDLFGSAADRTVPRSNDANASALELLWETLKCRVTDEFEEAAVAVAAIHSGIGGDVKSEFSVLVEPPKVCHSGVLRANLERSAAETLQQRTPLSAA
ncbi:hypothetical protein FOZ61_009425, partial [Perkinsus olseni]